MYILHRKTPDVWTKRWTGAEKSGKIKERKKVGTERGITGNRNFAMGLRKLPLHILTDEEIEDIKADAKLIGIDENVLRFNEDFQTGFSDKRDCINVRGDILPDLQSNVARDRMSLKTVLAHEYYGHYLHHPLEYEIGDWRDEFRASYDAAINTPNLSNEECKDLMVDAYGCAREADQPQEYDETARRIIYGY